MTRTPDLDPPDLDPEDLDPKDWPGLRAQGHRLLDDMFDFLQTRRGQPVWRAPTPDARGQFDAPLPLAPTDMADLRQTFIESILPYSSGNTHPGFMGWVQGGGTAVGMLGEMLAAGMNCNLGGRDHIALEVEQQILRWTRRMFDFPAEASGLFLTGTSQANFLATLIARTRALGPAARQAGLVQASPHLTAYASAAVHGCVGQAMDMAGLGRGALRLVAIDSDHRMDPRALEQAIAEDRAAGMRPFLIVGTAGSVDVGAIDPLSDLADIAAAEGLYFHIDGALGALGVLSPRLKPRLKGIERADSIGFDWHKWGQTPYDAGFLLVRDPQLHRDTFASEARYLQRAERGLAGGDWWPCDYGPDLSRGFRALKTWFTLKAYGLDALSAVIDNTCDLAQALAARVRAEPELELLAPVALNVVCFRFRSQDADAVNREMVIRLQEQGLVAPSLTRVNGMAAVRAAIVNHRTQLQDIETLVKSALDLGRQIEAESVARAQ